MAEGFSADLEYAIVKKLGIKPEEVQLLVDQYYQLAPQIPRMPAIHLLNEDHARAVLELADYTPDLDLDWNAFLHRIRMKDEIERDAQNPYLPRWDGKTDDRPTIWSEDTGPVSDRAKTDIMKIMRQCSPPQDRPLIDLMRFPIIPELDVLASILEAIKKHRNFILQPMGDNIDFRWSKTLCILAGLGLDSFRYMAEEMSLVEDDWGYYASCSDDELLKELSNARWVSGYPFGLIRADFHRLHQAIAPDELPKVPHWWGLSLLIHIIKHTRYFRNHRGRPHLFVAYKSRSAMLPLTTEGADLPLTALANQAMLKTFCDMLRIPKSAGGKKKNIYEEKSSSIFNFIRPSMLTRPLDMRTHSEMIYPMAVTTESMHTNREFNWINPGIVVCDTAHIDIKTGEVDANAHVTGAYALSMAWPHGEMDPEDLLNWKSNLPPRVAPMRPSQVLRALIRNVNDLGEPEGFDALIDGIMTVNMCRLDLAGTVLGNVLRNEFPLIWSLPMTAGLDDTTNQGKTNTARILGGCLLPNIRVVQASRTISAPAQRAVASPLEESGTAIYDEFTMPPNHEHFLSQAGLQMLATGGTVTPGRAMENSPGVRLKLPLFLVAKICTATPDIRNRSFPIFLDALNDKNKSTKQELAMIMSGQASLVMRLCLMRYIEHYQLVQRMRALPLSESDNRFNAHMSVCELFAAREAIERYLAKANKQFETQYAAAGESGLADDIGIETSFNLNWFYTRCDDQVLEQIEAECTKAPMTVELFTQYVVEDRNKRSLEKTISQYRMREDKLFRAVRQELKRHLPTRSGWTIKYMPKDQSNMWDKNRHRMDYIILVRDKPPEQKVDAAAEKKA